MKRSEFFKRLGFGAAAVVVAPKVITEALEEVKAPSAKVAEHWDVVISKPKQQINYNWYEEPRLHFKIKSEVIVHGKSSITVLTKEKPTESKFRVQDFILINNDSYLITRIGDENVDHTVIELVPFKTSVIIPSIGDEVELMLVGNSYIES